MAHIAALMSKRKKREQKRADTELSLRLPLQPEEPAAVHDVVKHFPYTYAGGGGGGTRSSTQTPSKLSSTNRATSEGTLRAQASIDSKEWSSRQMDSSQRETKDTIQNEDGSFETNNPPSYSAIYIGLILIAMGLVISFVGLGDKGFKTLELKLIGPVLCTIGLSCVFLKILQCNFPKLFACSKLIKKAKKKPRVDQSNLVERGMTNGHIKMTSTKNTPQQQSQAVLSPRVTLQSTVRSSRPRSTIPNYIEDTSDEDDFDPGRVKPHTNPLSSYGEQQKQNRAEILLTPKSLML